MWSNNNFGSNGAPAQDGAQDNNYQNNINQANFQENYQGSEINLGSSEYFVNFPPLTAGFPAYPLFPFEYYQPPNSNYIGSYMPNMFQQMPGFMNNAFLQTTFTSPANPEEAPYLGSVATAHPGISTQSVPPIWSTTSATPDAPTQTITLAKPATSMALNSRAEELKAQLIKSKEERAKAKNSLKPDEAGTDTLDPTSQEMASLLRGSPTKPSNYSKGPTSGSSVFSTSPENILKGIVTGTVGPISTRNEISAGGIAAEPKAHSSTFEKDNRPVPRDGFSGRRGSYANTIGKPRIDTSNKDSSNAKDRTNITHSPKGDGLSPLEKVLLSNNDVRDWLKLTKWDDLAHRKRALERHRAITAIDSERALLEESVAKIAALDKEKAKLVAETTDDEDGLGDKSPEGARATSTKQTTDSSEPDSLDPPNQATKFTPASATPRKRSFSSFTNSNRIPLQPNSRRSRAADAHRLSTSNTGKELSHDRHEHRGRSRERRDFTDPRDMSPRLRAFLEREDAREAREAEARRYKTEFRGSHHEEHRPSRGYRGQFRSRYRGYGDGRR